jgi:hypothetical protein
LEPLDVVMEYWLWEISNAFNRVRYSRFDESNRISERKKLS